MPTIAAQLVEAGLTGGPWMRDAIAKVQGGESIQSVVEQVQKEIVKKVPLKDKGADYFVALEPLSHDESRNARAVAETMDEVMRTPGVTRGAVMPDACPAGPKGIIPVGGVVESDYIHPSMHSADICCSVMLSEYDCGPRELLDAVHNITHFGPGGRSDQRFQLDRSIVARMERNPFFDAQDRDHAARFLGTQGDGNHFAFVGTRESTGRSCLVTHHGSRKLGAVLYKKGRKAAKKHCKNLCPESLNPWLDFDTETGEAYWEALQIVRDWTKANHEAIHQGNQFYSAQKDNFWNEHNFVFQRDGKFLHAKGATPAYEDWAHDATGLTLIPMNMAEPILITKGKNNHDALGFAPHGAGRNYSRTKHKTRVEGTEEEIFARETQGLDVRFFSGKIDVTELPSAYKNAEQVREQMERFGLAEVVDRVLPYGSIMAGDWESDALWRQRKAGRG